VGRLPGRCSVAAVTKALIAIHVIAVIITIGPITVAASMVPPVVRRMRSAAEPAHDLAVLRMLYRICRVYALGSIAVPVFGLAAAGPLHVLGKTWLIVSIVLTAVAAVILGLLVLPQQRAALAVTSGPGAAARTPPPPARLAMSAGLFNLVWLAVAVLMVVRPGN
jgi:hypothetical protein